MSNRQAGFTLIEISIVLVVIGLLLGGALKGQELIHSAKVKNLANELRVLPALIYTYQDRFRAIPGDDAQAQSHLGGPAIVATTPNSTLGNGMLNGAWNSSTTTDESYLFWQHVRLAGLLAGTTSAADTNYAQHNAEGGLIGITGNNNSPIKDLKGTYIACSQGISGRYAKQIDTQMDDGVSNRGSIQVMETPASDQKEAVSALGTLDDSQTYTLCYAF